MSAAYHCLAKSFRPARCEVPPPRTGSIEPLKRANGKTYYRARIRLGDGSRVRVDVPEKYSTAAGGKTAEERAELYALAVQEREDERGELLAKKRGAESDRQRSNDPKTLDAFAAGVFDRREGEGKSSIGRERRMWKARISERLGALAVKAVTKEQIEDFRDYLDAEVRERIGDTKGEAGISGKTAMIVWTLVRTVFKDATNSRDRTKRVRPDDPTLGVLPPLRTRSRKKTFIFPNEFAQLIAADAVPREWRELYAIAAYLYLRPGELRALTWKSVDVDAGIVSVVQAFDEEAGEAKATKTERGQREVPIAPALLPLLESLKRRAKPTDLVAPLLATVKDNRRAMLFRTHLALAKVERSRLVEDSATTMAVNFRSLRDSGITWEALAGTSVDRIQSRAGHEHISTTLGYMKAVEDLKGKFGTPFGPLPFPADAIGPRIGPSDTKASRKPGKQASQKLRLLDSNPRKHLEFVGFGRTAVAVAAR
jgi:integrase